MKKMKRKDIDVMFVTTTLSGGGAERVVSIWASELAERGYSVAIMLAGRVEKEYPLSPKVRVECVAPCYEDYKKLSSKDKYFRKRKIIKGNKPKYVISFLSQNRIWTFLCTLGIRCRTIETIRNSPWHEDIPGGVSGIITKLSFNKCYRIILQSSDQAPYFSRKIQNKAVIIPNPISEMYMDHYKNEFPKCPKIVIAAGRLAPQKNYFMMIDAFASVCAKKETNNVVLKIFGGETNSAYTGKLRSYIQKKGLNDKVLLMGRNSAIEDEYSKADIFLMSSDYEGMPNSLAEAMASKLVCISTDCKTGPRDLINDGVNGFLVPTGNSAEMAEKLIAAINLSVEQRKNIGEAARKKILTYCSKEKSVEKLAEVLNNEL